jgi:kexin
MIIVLLGAGIGAFFYVRSRRRNQNLFGLANNGEGARGAYAPLSEDVPMGLLERGRRKLGGGGGGGSRNAAGTKELYDAFGDGPSDDSEDDGLDERTALRYHDDFLDDEDGHEHAHGHDEGRHPPEYRDEPEEKSSGSGSGGSGAGAEGRGGDASQSGTGSSSSWQDAADEAPRS